MHKSGQKPKKQSLRLLLRLIITVIILLVILGLSAPFLLKIEAVQKKMVERLRRNLHCQILLDDIDWQWLPLPHISLAGIRVENPEFSLHLPETIIYPNWRAIFNDSAQFGLINLNKPSLQVNFPLSGQSANQITLPALKFNVVDGNLLLLDSKQSSPLKSILPLKLAEISGNIETRPTKLNFQINTTTPFCQTVNLLGWYDLSSLKYQANFQLDHLNVAECLIEKQNSPFIFDSSAVTLAGSVNGQGNDQLSVELKGEIPALTLQIDHQKTYLQPGTADLFLTSSAANLHLDINQLNFSSPAFLLSGSIDRQIAEPTKPPIWNLDLKGNDMDVGSIRGSILDMLGQDKIAALICNIVQGGKAQWATYKFKGTAAEFEHLTKMKIRVGGINSTIYIPWGDLSLREARGDIAIINGYLSGRGLSARLGNSYGSNCNIDIDLLERTNKFLLDIDLDADVKDIPPVLHNLIKWPAFIEQVNHFSEIAGKASGRLRIGDSLDKLDTYIDIASLEGSFRYKPITWPIRIFGGSMKITPTLVQWQDIKTTAGEQLIHSAAGEIDWTDEPLLSLTEGIANLDASTFFKELQRHNLVPEDIKKSITGLNGRIRINNLVMIGPLAEPKHWKYNLGYTFQGLRLTSPMLPYPILFEKNTGHFSDTTMSFENCRAWILEQPYSLNGSLQHNKLANWTGSISTTGLLRDPLAGWIKKNNWIPPLIFPALPCKLENFSIGWTDTETTLHGTLRASGSIYPPKVFLDLKTNPSGIFLHKAKFTHKDQQGELSMQLVESPEKLFSLSWKGELLSSTLDRLLEKNQLLNGMIKGNFNFMAANSPAQSTVQGDLWVGGVNIPTKDNDISINELALKGLDDKLEIEKLNLTINDETINISGQLQTTATGIAPNLELWSDSLSRTTLESFRSKPVAGVNDQPLSIWEKMPIFPWDSIGTCNFKIRQFHEQSVPDRDYKDLKGQLEWFAGDDLCTNISEAVFCGLPIFGRWCSETNLVKNTLVIKTDDENPPLFQEILPCLGGSDNLIQGSVKIEATLQHEKNQWSIGKVKIHSSDGRIKKLVLLSKVLSMLNITELFTGTTLQDLSNNGFSYADMDIEAIIKNNRLILEKAVVQGDGLNLFAKGSIALDTMEADITLLVAPFKTFDLIITSVPILGKAVTGPDEALVSIPFSITGNLKEPHISILPPKAVGQGILDLLTNTLKLPYTLISPLIEMDK